MTTNRLNSTNHFWKYRLLIIITLLRIVFFSELFPLRLANRHTWYRTMPHTTIIRKRSLRILIYIFSTWRAGNNFIDQTTCTYIMSIPWKSILLIAQLFSNKDIYIVTQRTQSQHGNSLKFLIFELMYIQQINLFEFKKFTTRSIYILAF